MQEAPTTAEIQNSIVQLAVWPKSVALGVGQSTRFVAYGLTSAHDSILADVTWSASGGTIAPTGEFTAGADTGAFSVTATHALKLWLADSATVEVQEVAPALVRLALWPQNPTLAVGDSLDFFAVGLTASGDTMLVDVTWTADGGSLVSRGQGQGRYKASQSGTHKVKASADSLQDSTTVTVTPVPVATVTVAPATPQSHGGADGAVDGDAAGCGGERVDGPDGDVELEPAVAGDGEREWVGDGGRGRGRRRSRRRVRGRAGRRA